MSFIGLLLLCQGIEGSTAIGVTQVVTTSVGMTDIDIRAVSKIIANYCCTIVKRLRDKSLWRAHPPIFFDWHYSETNVYFWKLLLWEFEYYQNTKVNFRHPFWSKCYRYIYILKFTSKEKSAGYWVYSYSRIASIKRARKLHNVSLVFVFFLKMDFGCCNFVAFCCFD